MIETLQDIVTEKEESSVTKVDELLGKEKLFLDLQSGIATLYEKLKNVKLKPVS